MADVKISALPSATTPLAGTELVPVVQAGITTQTTVTDIVAKAPVQSVAGKTGAVTLTPSDVGAEPADATILKSASIGVTVQGYNANTVVDVAYVHTDNNYTTAEKSKLAGIADGAEVNINADWNAVSGDAQILNKPTLGTAAATASTDYATAAQGALADSAVQPAAIANMLETADIGVTVQGYSSVLANTTASFTTSDETKLDGIAAGAEVNVNADWTAVSGDAQILNKPTLGTAAATNSTDYATAAQGALADSAVQPIAIANMLETSDIGVTVQGYSSVLANTTASFTTADEAKLDGIQAGAEVNVNADWNAVSGDAQILNKPTLGTAAAANTTDFATAAQGTKADSALQPAAIGVSVQAYDADLTSWAAITPSTKQNTLVSGTNIKTINGNSLLGSGDLTISGGGGSLAVSDEGTSLTTGATSFNFVGSGVSATASGTAVTVTVPGGGGGGGSADIQEFTTPGSSTWTKPAGAKFVEVLLFSGGSGGGSGRRRAIASVATAATGGAGGHPGSRTFLKVPASYLPSTVSVTVGSGGTGGAAATVDDTNGNFGNDGNDSIFGSFARARRVYGGSSGATSSGGGSSGGGGDVVAQNYANIDASPRIYRSAGAQRSTSGGGQGYNGGYSGGGGGSGGGFQANSTTENAGGAGGTGGAVYYFSEAEQAGGGAGGSTGSPDGSAGQNSVSRFVGGNGGGSGASKTTGAGGNGGAGGYPGGGGGGGGAGYGVNSGAGGNGGGGYVLVTTYF